MESRFTEVQEAVRKDIESIFGFLQVRFKIFLQERDEWSNYIVIRINEVCAIFHSFIVQMGSGALLNRTISNFSFLPQDQV